MEIFDIVDMNGNPTGETIERTKAHEIGAMHRTAHIWVVRENNNTSQVLLQKRSSNKDSFPNRLDTSSAGHIQAGDEPLESAIRELGEELGIAAKPEDLKFAGTFIIDYEKEFHGKMFKDKEIAFVYVYDKGVDINALTLQTEEVSEVMWCDLDEAYNGTKNHNPIYCIPIGGLDVLKNYLNK